MHAVSLGNRHCFESLYRSLIISLLEIQRSQPGTVSLGTLFELGCLLILTQGGFSVSVGGEYRVETAKVQGDPIQTIDPVTGVADPLGFNVAVNQDYKRTTFSTFAELSIPAVVPTMKVSRR